MARANRNTLRHSRIEMDRNQRQEEPQVPGATGPEDVAPEDVAPEAAETRARKRRGKTRKNVRDDT
jgi:hypothetical protein